MKYGFIKPEIKPEDYVFGFQLTPEVLQEDGQWDNFLPKEEMQRKYGLETSNCTVFGTLNAIEILFNRLYGVEVNYSERFTGVLAETKPEGNNPQKVAEVIRKKGVIGDDLLPFSPNINEWEEYYSPNPMKAQYLVEGKKWLNKYVFKHDWVFTNGTVERKNKLLIEALKTSPVCVDVDAWHKKGRYYVRKRQSNHWVTIYGYSEGKYWKIFDHYDDTHKKLEWNYDFNYAKRYTISINQNPEKSYDFLINIVTAIKDIIKDFVSSDAPQEDKDKVIKDTTDKLKVIKENMSNKLLKIAKDNLNKDVTPEDKVPDEVACSETVSRLINNLYKDFKILPFTGDLYLELKKDPRFRATLNLEAGNIICSPTGYGNGLIRGHVGIIMENGKIASNNSYTGLFEENFTIPSWIKRYRNKGGFPIYVFEVV